MEDSRHRPAQGFWALVADLVVAHPLPILSVCLLVLLPLAAVGARSKSNHSQLSDLDPDTPSVIGTSDRQTVFRRRRTEPGDRTHPPSRARLPIAAGPSDDRRAEPQAARDRQYRRGSLAHSAARQASFHRTRSWTFESNRRPGRRHGGRVAVRRHPARRRRPTAITSPGSTSSSSPTPSPKRASALSKKCETALQSAAVAGQPLAGAPPRSASPVRAPMLHDLKSVTTLDQRRMYFLVTIGVYADSGRASCGALESASI